MYVHIIIMKTLEEKKGAYNAKRRRLVRPIRRLVRPTRRLVRPTV